VVAHGKVLFENVFSEKFGLSINKVDCRNPHWVGTIYCFPEHAGYEVNVDYQQENHLGYFKEGFGFLSLVHLTNNF